MGRQPFEVVGYTYEADHHCMKCAVKRFGARLLRDEYPVHDNEGNVVTPLFLDAARDLIAVHREEFDEQGDTGWDASIICGTCGKTIEEE